MKYYFSLRRFFEVVEGHDDTLPPLVEETEAIKADYENNDTSDWWLLERKSYRASKYGYQEDGTFKDPCEFETLAEAMDEYKEHFNDAVADYLYF